MTRTEDDAMGRVFKALADPTRRRLLDRLHADNGQTLGALCHDLGITRQGITQHLDLLVAANLISTVRRGRERLHYLNPVPLHEIHARWIAKFEQPDLDALGNLKHRLEQETVMDKPNLVYVTYIATTPEKLWQALTDPDLTARYWGHRNVSGWAKGDSWEHRRISDGGSDGGGVIEEIDPPRRLVHTWAPPGEQDNPAKRSRVSYELEPVGDAVRLTLINENVPDEWYEGSSTGWPMVLASLKSFLETGQPMTHLWGG